jgi:hypothetical protein
LHGTATVMANNNWATLREATIPKKFSTNKNNKHSNDCDYSWHSSHRPRRFEWQGRRTLIHNRNFMLLCQQFADDYRLTKKQDDKDKQGISMRIVKGVQDNPGRFLQEVNGQGWVDISYEKAVRM